MKYFRRRSDVPFNGRLHSSVFISIGTDIMLRPPGPDTAQAYYAYHNDSRPIEKKIDCMTYSKCLAGREAGNDTGA